MSHRFIECGQARMRPVLLAVLAWVVPTLGYAQSVSVVGRVTGDAGIPLAGIEVGVEAGQARAITDREGRYFLIGLEAGSHTIRVTGLGYRTFHGTIVAKSGDTVRQDVRLDVEPVLLDGLTVEGQRRGQAMAMQQQCTADNVRSVVAAEYIGRLPDPNAAEALQRLPGVSVQRDQGEGRYVIVRGAEPRLNMVSVDGTRLPAPDGAVRTVALDVIPSDLLASVEVHKTLTPDMDGDAIGGSVNLVTRSAPMDRDISEFMFAGGMNDLTSDEIVHVSGLLTRRVGKEGQHGLSLASSYHGTRRGAEDLEMEWGEHGGSPVLDDLDLRDYRVARTRIGGSASYQYDPADGVSSLGVRLLFNEYRDQEFRGRSRLRFGKGDYVSVGSVRDARLERSLKDRLEVQRIWSVSTQGWRLAGAGRLDYRVGYARSGEDEPHRSDITFVQKGMDFDVDVRDPKAPSYAVATGAEFDGSAYDFDEWVVENNTTRDTDVFAGLDYAVPMAFLGGSDVLKVGVKARWKSKERTNDVQVFDGFDGDLTLAELAALGRDPHIISNRYRVGPTPDPTLTRDFTAANQGIFEQDDDASREETAPANYLAGEDVYAGYVMGTFARGSLRVLPGVRFEATRVAYTGNEVLFDESGDYASTTPVSRTGSYVSWLPGVQVRLALAPRMNLRGAVTRSIGRPDYYDLVPYRLAFREDQEVALGNPDLSPTRATNFDLLFEAYAQTIGVFSAGVFHKRLSGYTYLRRYEMSSGPFEGFEAIQPWNAGAGSLSGVEFAWSRQLVSLPGFLNGLSLHLNYTGTRSETELLGRSGTVPLPGQARHVGNAAVGYEKYGFSGRIALNHHGSYVSEIGESAEEDIFYASHTQVDLSAAYTVSPAAQLFFEVVNLTNEPLSHYQGSEVRPVQREFYSWWGQVGIKVNRF